FFASGAGRAASIGSGTVLGGTLETANGGVITTVGGRTATVGGVTNLGTTYVVQGSTMSVLSSGMTNNGSLYVNNGATPGANLVFANGAVIGGTGTVTLNPAPGWYDRAVISTTSTNTDTATIGAGVTLNGNGTISGSLINNGRIAPGVGIGRIDRPGAIQQ